MRTNCILLGLVCIRAIYRIIKGFESKLDMKLTFHHKQPKRSIFIIVKQITISAQDKIDIVTKFTITG